MSPLFCVLILGNILFGQDANLSKARYYHSLLQNDSTVVYSSVAFNELRQKDPKKALAAAYFLSSAYTNLGKLDSSLKVNKQALSIARELDDPKIIAAIAANIAVTYINSGNVSSAIQLLNESLRLNSLSGDSISYHRTLLTLADAFKYLGMLDSAVSIGFRAHHFIEKNDNSSWRQIAIESVSDYLLASGDSIDALNILNKGLDIAPEQNHLNRIAILLKMAKLFFATNPDKSLQLLAEIEHLGSEINSPSIIANSIQTALEYDLQVDAPESTRLPELIQLRKQSQDNLGIADAFFLQAKFYQLTNEELLASGYLDSAVALAQAMANPNYLFKYLAYKIELRTKSVDASGRLFKLIQETDSIDHFLKTIQKDQILQFYRTQFSTSEKEKKVIEQQLEVDRLQLQILALASVIITLIGLATMLLYRYRLKNRHAQLLLTLNEDQRHRVSNQLGLISSILSISENDDNVQLKEAQNRVDAITLINSQLSIDKDFNQKLSTVEFFEALIQNLFIQYSKDSDKATIEIRPLELDLSEVIPLALIANEVLTNHMKYAKESLLRIFLFADDQCVMLTIEDDGPGYNQQSVEKRRTSGLKLIRTFSRQLKAKLTIHSVEGVKVSLEIPR